ADREEHDRGVDDVAAVSSPVARDEAREGVEPALARGPARPRSLDELLDDAGEDEDGERVRDESRDARPRSAGAERDARDDRRDERPADGAPDAADGAPPPGDERPDPHQQEQRQPEGAQEE